MRHVYFSVSLAVSSPVTNWTSESWRLPSSAGGVRIELPQLALRLHHGAGQTSSRPAQGNLKLTQTLNRAAASVTVSSVWRVAGWPPPARSPGLS